MGNTNSDNAHDLKAFWKENGKTVIIVLAVVITVIVGVTLTLHFVLQRPTTSVTVSYPPSNQPSDINGDPPQSSNAFAYPQIIANPKSSGWIQFGRLVFASDAGYICAVVSNGTPGSITSESLMMYYTNSKGEVQGPQEIPLSTYLPSGWGVYSGAFMPILNVSGEVYYLFVSVGQFVSGAGGVCPIAVLGFSLDTNTTSTVWKAAQINTRYSITFPSAESPLIIGMRLPISSSSINPASPYQDPSTPWYIVKCRVCGPECSDALCRYASFGNKIQGVLDDNQTITKQSLYVQRLVRLVRSNLFVLFRYVSGSEYDSSKPGGNVYWFILQDNSANPSIVQISTIQDAKLLLLKAQGPCSTPYDSTTAVNCFNGFGSDFYVTSGNGKSNILVVANSTNQDCAQLSGVNQPDSANGYVQGYILDQTTFTIWTQPQSGGVFSYRYIAPRDVPQNGIINNYAGLGGFANSVTVIQGRVVIGQGFPNSAGNATFLVFDWLTLPYQSNQMTPFSTIDPTKDGGTTTFPLTGMWASNSTTGYTRFSQGVTIIDDGSNQILVQTYYQPAAADVLSVESTNESNPMSSFAVVQSIGAAYSSQTSGSPIQPAFEAFAQSASLWLSRTGQNTRIVINDPNFVGAGDVTGRIVIFTRRRQG